MPSFVGVSAIFNEECERRGGLMVSEMDSESSGPCSRALPRDIVLFLGKTLNTMCLSTQVYRMCTMGFNAGGNPAMDS